MKLQFIGDVYLKEKKYVDFELDNYICNLEYPLSKNGIPAKNKINLGQNKSYLLETFKKYPLAVNLANNHIFDYGENGVSETLNYLKKHNIKFFGVSSEKDSHYSIVENNNKKIALFGFCSKTSNPVIKCGKYKLSLLENIDYNEIINVKKKVDFVIVNIHWGIEQFKMPRYEDTLIAKKLIDLGVNLIVGHHPHVLQPIEKYKNKYIFYSIGNFIFSDLEELSFFNGNKFTKKYIEKQTKENKKSIVVNWENGKVNYFTTFYDNKKVYKKFVSIPNKIPNTNLEFLKYKKLKSRWLMISNFLSNPRIPNIQNIKNFLNIK